MYPARTKKYLFKPSQLSVSTRSLFEVSNEFQILTQFSMTE